MIKAILKSLLFIPMLFIFITSILLVYFSATSFQTPEYTYAGESNVTLDQYHKIKSETTADNEILRITNISNDKLTIIYQFNSVGEFNYLTIVKQDTLFWISFWTLILSILILIFMLTGSISLVKWIRNG